MFDKLYKNTLMVDGQQPYIIKFIDVAVPDISTEPSLAEVLNIKQTLPDGYTVLSTVNDTELKALIKEAYGLAANQFIVQSHRVL